ncbi:HNH endonuclease family protein [Corallococcus sp. M7]
MRFIDRWKKWKPSPEWLKKAEKKLAEIEKLPPEERDKAIEKSSKIWSALKKDLADLSDKKCWYCESKQIRSDNAVDHFRPKGAIFESPDHPGYWWLAFTWRNYRYTCGFCNSPHVDHTNGTQGGKHHHFPLLDEKLRAKGPSDDLEKERPLLLDPTSSFDPGLLAFNPDGRPVPAYSEKKNSFLHHRAKISIKAYHLDHVPLCEERVDACQSARRLIEQGNKYFDRYQSTYDDTALDELMRVVDELQTLIAHDAEYTAAVKAAVLNYYITHDWLAEALKGL